MSRRLTVRALVLVGCLSLLATPAAAGLCARLTVPAALELDCRETSDPAIGERAIVAPAGGTFSALSRMSVRQLDPVTDRLAWDDPAAWLERQMIVDLDGVADSVRNLAEDPDSPFGGEMLRSAIATMVSGLEGLSRLPLAACGEGPSSSALTCRFGVEPFGLVMQIMLAGEEEARFAFNIRTFNEQRLRHLTAIANSFDAP